MSPRTICEAWWKSSPPRATGWRIVTRTPLDLVAETNDDEGHSKVVGFLIKADMAESQ